MRIYSDSQGKIESKKRGVKEKKSQRKGEAKIEWKKRRGKERERVCEWEAEIMSKNED